LPASPSAETAAETAGSGKGQSNGPFFSVEKDGPTLFQSVTAARPHLRPTAPLFAIATKVHLFFRFQDGLDEITTILHLFLSPKVEIQQIFPGSMYKMRLFSPKPRFHAKINALLSLFFPGTKNPGTKNPGAKNPGTKNPGAKIPGAKKAAALPRRENGPFPSGKGRSLVVCLCLSGCKTRRSASRPRPAAVLPGWEAGRNALPWRFRRTPGMPAGDDVLPSLP